MKQFYKKNIRLSLTICTVLFLVMGILSSFIYSYAATPSDPDNPDTTYSAPGTPIDSIVESSSQYVGNATEIVTDFLLSFLCNSFSPNFLTLLDLEEGRSMYLGDAVEGRAYTKSEVMNTVFFKNVMGLGIIVGSCLATALLVGYLILCLCGQSAQIRDNPIWLVVKYILSMIAIYLSADIVFEMTNMIYRLWSEFIINSHYDALTYTYESTVGNIVYTEEGRVRVLGVYSPTTLNFYWKCILPLIQLFLIWKLIKQLIRLYLEIAERYFVLIVLGAFFPTAVATCVGNGTRNIFLSYLRMFFCQGFVMLCNMAFMKFFLYVLLSGGWTAGPLNYIAALAFLRVCQRIDAYMMAMGLNVAQTGVGIANSIGGAYANLMRISMLARTVSGVGRTRENLGRAIQVAGANSNNRGLFNTGGFIGATTRSYAAAGGSLSSDAHFNDMVTHLHRGNAMNTGELVMNNGSKPNAEWLSGVAKERGIPTTQLNGLAQKGIDLSQVSQVECVGKNQYMFKDADGNNLALSKNYDILTNPTSGQEKEERSRIQSVISAGSEEAQQLGENPYDTVRSKYTTNDINPTQPTSGLVDYEALVGDGAKLQNVSFYGNADTGSAYRSGDEIGVEKALLRKTAPSIENAANQDELIRVTTYDITSHPEMIRYTGRPDYKSMTTSDGRGLICHIEHNYKPTPTADLSNRPADQGSKNQNGRKHKKGGN